MLEFILGYLVATSLSEEEKKTKEESRQSNSSRADGYIVIVIALSIVLNMIFGEKIEELFIGINTFIYDKELAIPHFHDTFMLFVITTIFFFIILNNILILYKKSRKEKLNNRVFTLSIGSLIVISLLQILAYLIFVETLLRKVVGI